MGEPLSWLRLGQRARTPITPLAAHPPECKATHGSQSCEPRRPGSSRMSTRTPPEPGLEAPSTDEGTADFLVRDQDQVWYNPSLEQMVEALQVLLMTHGILEPIPIQYNTYVLHLVEGFAVAQRNTRKAESAYQEARRSLEQNLEQFRLVAEEWLERESQYRAEVKRLEVLLSKCSRSGLEAVALARTNSIVDRSSSKGAGFLLRLDELRKQHADNSPPPRDLFISNRTCRTQIQESQTGEDRRTRETGGGPERGTSLTQNPLTGPLSVPYELNISFLVLTPKILDNDNDCRMSEKICQQYMATRASTASREWWAHRRTHTLRPEVNIMKRYQDSPCNPGVGIATVPAMASRSHQIHQEAESPIKAHVEEGKVSTAFSIPKGSKHQDEAPSMPELSAPNFSYHAKGSHQDEAPSMPELSAPNFSYHAKGSQHANVAATAATASSRHERHERDHSPFSFETGDDLDLFPRPTEGEIEVDTPYTSHKGPESTGTGRYRRCDDDANRLEASKEKRPPTGNGNPTTHLFRRDHSRRVPSPCSKPVRGRRDAVYSRQATIGGSPSQCSHNFDPPLAASPAEQEVSQRQQAETNARIAAKLALANVHGRTSQNT
ncbi:hypothetical protein F5Y01DRAFT_323237 [Xylaria sp. FL0043]|nr:hypothetical protein F5Y01DRAFT_323237 [Xylaria sp. FL0043]